MEEQKKVNTEEPQEEKGGFFSKFKKGVVAGAKFVGGKLEKAANSIKSSIDEAKAKKALEETIVQQFNSKASSFVMVIPGSKEKYTKVFARIDYDAKTITLLGKIETITREVYFIDSAKQKFEVKLIRLNQSMDFTVENVVHSRDVTVIEYRLSADEETKKQMQTFITNNSITITDSVINKSDIG